MKAKNAVLVDVRNSVRKSSYVPGTRALKALSSLGTIPDAHPGSFELDSMGRSLYPMQLGVLRDPACVGELRGVYGDAWNPSLSLYGARRKPHNGVDIYAPVGTPIVATVSGRLQFKDDGNDLGKRAWLSFNWQGRRWRFIYGHLDRFEEQERSVSRGEVIGYCGCTGNADKGEPCSKPNRCGLSSAHVHLILADDTNGSKFVDPLDQLDWKLRYRNDERSMPCEQVVSTRDELLAVSPVAPDSPTERLLFRQGAILEQLSRIRELLGDKKLAGETVLNAYRAELFGLLSDGVTALHTAGNVDTGAAPKDRALAVVALAEECAKELDANGDSQLKATVVRFMARLVWHESAQLLHRRQLASGPARGFSQFEAHRAKDALECARQKKLLSALATVAGETVAAIEAATKALPAYGTARSAYFPAGNLIEKLLLDNDLFGVYLTRIAFKKVPDVVPAGIPAQADCWFKHWKGTDPDPQGVKQKFIFHAQQFDSLWV